MENKHFKCFKCHFHNKFYIPIGIKGRKCNRCKIYNYFNSRDRNRNNNYQSRAYIFGGNRS